ncbi:hypothetical protein [Gorillibacterium sp. sgz5001074]|uniref:hypothetical protein n=1 Tax=Gorillibacterium sp. sgz5001074 TaxID=3446695 RepID=UPI003F676C0D
MSQERTHFPMVKRWSAIALTAGIISSYWTGLAGTAEAAAVLPSNRLVRLEVDAASPAAARAKAEQYNNSNNINKNINNVEQVVELSAGFDAGDPENPAYSVRVFVLDRLTLDGTALPEVLSNKLIISE